MEPEEKVDIWLRALQFIQQNFQAVKKAWRRIETLFLIALGLTVVAIMGYPARFLQSFDFSTFLINVGILLPPIIIVWIITRRPHITPRNKIGFGISVVTENKTQQEKILHDFILTLRRLLLFKNLKHNFHFIDFSPEIEVTDPNVAFKLLKSSRLAFLIFGRVRTRKIKGVDTHFLEFSGVVAHKSLNPVVQKEFSKEFGALFPGNMSFPTDKDMYSFNFAAEWIHIVATYIIAAAMTLSGNLEYSQELFEDLTSQLNSSGITNPASEKIRERVPRWLAAIYGFQAQRQIHKWSKTKRVNNLNNAKKFLDKLDEVDSTSYPGSLLRSIWYFASARDVKSAKAEVLKGSKTQNDVNWRYSYAFLLAYEGSLDKAIKEYRRAFKRQMSQESIEGIIDFIKTVLRKEPDKIQLHFCLGLLYRFQLKKNTLANREFEKFISKLNSDDFNELSELAKGYLSSKS